MHILLRASLLAAALAHPPAGLSQPAASAGYPDPARVIRLVVPAPPGGPGDVVARALARELTASLKSAIVVENKPGGASIPGALEVARAPADGYTLLLTLNTTHTQVPHLYAKAPFDPFADFTPVAQVYRGSSVLVAHPSLPARNLAEAIALSRTQAVAFASPSPGTTGHLYIEALNADHGARFIHVPYKGSNPAVQDLLAGHVQLLFDSPATAVPHVRSGRLKALAATGSTRLASLPDLPTAKEQGFAGFESSTWLGVFGPAGLPPPIVATLNREISQAVNASQLREQFSAMGVELVGTSPEAFRDVIRKDHDEWGRLIKRINLKLD
ncbi:Bug family tripartite tricarboxylate transporter substrate binding protein [Variovorax saccharolyticus]|uniref:Bug family tripartite tricarboxylate transporter substrate binding protein n=1 Tax=Variovorax saccharolyticus TaxID=3053516 RepID=UPI0025750206|nr:tripartite tricarboxylate transporter substrate binding protein [Variovorax sp. J31P216]MDM0026157.1 tripartite tricarboxylate transporter substrate binding protein [Variovorax sp. J31P216]